MRGSAYDDCGVCVCVCVSLSLLHLDSMPGSISLAVLSVWTLIPVAREGISLLAIGSRLLGVNREAGDEEAWGWICRTWNGVYISSSNGKGT
jgi:hypothetical protein